jgi:DtxR family Mn-dependent transcriptional regulator
MSPMEIFRTVWSQSRPRRAASDAGADCPDGIPEPQGGHCDDCDSTPLTGLAPGDEATIACLDAETRAVARLAALGILPGVRVRLVQRYPAYVFRLGYGEVAIDESLAATVRVRR